MNILHNACVLLEVIISNSVTSIGEVAFDEGVKVVGYLRKLLQ